MCGFFGITKFNNTLDLIKARESLNTLSHRGPDQWGDWYDDSIYVGHRRLSIIDLTENGIQPMIRNGVTIAVNGEIYNFQQIKDELSDQYIFNSQSDSEVILAGYQIWGIDVLLEKIDGMFALCIYDQNKKKLFLVRDRFGKKPLFYATYKEKILFSSEIKAIFKFENNLRVFSYKGIADWVYHRGSHSSQTIYHNIYKLEPGSYLEIKRGRIRKIKYYDILDSISKSNNYSSLLDVNELLEGAVQRRLISDVPVGLQLSGGVDSSLIGYYMRKFHTGEMHSFSVGFSEPQYLHYSEEKYARFVAEKLNFQHHQYNITMHDVINSFEKVIYLFDGMLDYPNAIPIYLLSLYSKKYVSVMLTGEGADELFGGYNKLKRMDQLAKNTSLFSLIPSFLFELAGGGKMNTVARNIYLSKEYSGKLKQILEDINCYISPPTFRKIFQKNKNSLFNNISYEQISKLPFFKQLLIMDHKTYLYSLLDRQDRASMGAGIESRLPFLDKGLIEKIVPMPQSIFFNKKHTKIALKKISENIYGKDFTYRAKKGFPLPISDWLDNKNGFQPYLDKVFEKDFLLREKIDYKFMLDYLNKRSFDNKLLNYGDSERIWIKWFLMVLRTTQDVFHITDIR